MIEIVIVMIIIIVIVTGIVMVVGLLEGGWACSYQ